MKNKKTISILGCGWLGLPLGEALVKDGFYVKGSTTQKAKSFFLYDKGIEPFILKFNPELTGRLAQDFFATNIVIITIPPGMRKNGGSSEQFLERIQNIIKQIVDAKIKHVIFTSSTSVYGNTNELITETTPLNPETDRAKALVEAEKLFLNEKKLKPTILRISGMVGPDRHPGKFFKFSNEKRLGGLTPINLIHLVDVVNIIRKVVIEGKWGQIYNLVSDTHPTKKQFYTFATLNLELPPAIFKKESSFPNRIISNKKVKRSLGYKLIHPDLEALYCED